MRVGEGRYARGVAPGPPGQVDSLHCAVAVCVATTGRAALEKTSAQDQAARTSIRPRSYQSRPEFLSMLRSRSQPSEFLNSRASQMPLRLPKVLCQVVPKDGCPCCQIPLESMSRSSIQSKTSEYQEIDGWKCLHFRRNQTDEALNRRQTSVRKRGSLGWLLFVRRPWGYLRTS